MKAHIVLLPGDGIGPEVVEEGRQMLAAVAASYGHHFTYEERLIGGCAIDAQGTALANETLAACRAADAVLLGAVGGPKWDNPASPVRPEQGLLGLRYHLGLFANLRPVHVFPELVGSSPLHPERLAGVDILFLRELTGGIYFGEPRIRESTPAGVRAVDSMVYTDAEIRRIVRLAFQLAQTRRRRLTSVDKANVLETSRLWRQTVIQVAAEFPDVQVEHQLVDSMAMKIILNPAAFDVVVTENLFGDILTDEASVLAGSLGMLPSASLGAGKLGVYEPVHGSAPDIAGRGIANPIGTLLSAALLLRYSLGLEEEAQAVERAVASTLAAGARTADLAGGAASLSTREMGAAVRERLENQPPNTQSAGASL